MKRTLLALGLAFIGIVPTKAQGTFQNLNFESAQVIISTNFGVTRFIASTNALPGWSAFVGTNQLSQIQYNYSGLVINSSFVLVGSNADVIDGNFSVYFTGQQSGGSISQTGLVPNGTESLLFDATSSSFLVSLGGQSLSFIAISNALNSYGRSYTIYGADISAFAGQIETLTFLSSPANYGTLDDIRFSPEVVPEPSTISLLCLGSGVLLYLRRKNVS